MKRSSYLDSVGSYSSIFHFQGFSCENEDPPKRFSSGQKETIQYREQEKRIHSDLETIPDKRVCLNHSYPTFSINTAELPSPWNIQPNGIPQSFIHKMEEEVFKQVSPYLRFIIRQSWEYRNQSLIVYTPSTDSIQSNQLNQSVQQIQSIPPIPSNHTQQENEEDQDEDIGPISYYYSAPMNDSTLMEIVSSPEEDSSSTGWGLNYHDQIMETGLRGMQPMNW